MAITDRVRVGQTVQFHVRDADTADEDLRLLLRQDRAAHAAAAGRALLFTCNGRGTRLFGEPHHDAGGRWPRNWGRCRWPASSRPASSGRSAARTSSTASRPAR